MRFLRCLFIFAAFLLPGVSFALDHVVLQLKWRHQFQFAGYYAAIAQGYYRDAGLEVELREAVPGKDPLEEVVDGHAQYGVGTSNVILARAEGKPVVVLAVIYQHSPFVLMASKESGIKDIQDLADKPIMMEPDAAELIAYFDNEGVKSSRLHLIPHSFDVHDLINGKAAAMSAYSTDEPFHMKAAGAEYEVFTPRAGGIDFYGDNLFTTEGEIAAHPDRVRAFLKASLQGWVYAMSHRDEMVDLIERDYNRGKTPEQLRFEADETAKLVHPELIELGYINPGRWHNIAHTYEHLGMLPKDFSLNGFLYDTKPHLDLRWLYWTGGVILAIVLASAGWTLSTWNLNRKLRREITAREQAEARAHAESAAKEHFYAVLAHEVRAPLSGIISALWLYEKTSSPEEKRDFIKTSEDSATNLLSMVDHILEHSKIESGHVEIVPVSVDVVGFLDEIIALFRAVAATKELSLVCEIAPNVPATIITDPVRLRQILSNLLANALKFTKQGEVKLSVTVPNASCIVFQVRDTGAGIAAEKIARIFEPYAQADSTVSGQYGGTGLGLSISSRLAHLLGGDISVASQLGQGSTFSVTLPVAPGSSLPS